MNCRHCNAPLDTMFVDLGYAPPSNAYRLPEQANAPEVSYPLRVRICAACLLVQTEDYAEADMLFDADYAYFSSTSKHWLEHAKTYCDRIIQRLGLNGESFVVEIASNDGYLLRNMVAAGVPCIGIEPTDSTACVSEALGIPTRRAFFGEGLARELRLTRAADLIIGNNVYAHVPDINNFTAGLAAFLAPSGTITLEFPHVAQLIQKTQFDTIYHEHFSYLSLYTVSRIFTAHGLRIYDVERLETHGGSLRVFGCHKDAPIETSKAVALTLETERDVGLTKIDGYLGLQSRAEACKDGLLRFLLDAKASGKSILGYGAAAKGNTILNFAGIRPDLLPAVADAAPSKQGKLMPGSRIPIITPDALRDAKPDYVLILPWNIAREVRESLAELAASGTRFVTAVPEIVVK